MPIPSNPVVFPPNIPSVLSMPNRPTKPSKHYCKTGELEENEMYNANLHFHGETPQERCAQFYSEYNVPPIPAPIPVSNNNNNNNTTTNHVAGKRYPRKMRRRPYRKYIHRKRRVSKRR